MELQAHDVAARRRTDQAGAHVRIALVQGPDVAGVLVMIDDLIAVGHGCFL